MFLPDVKNAWTYTSTPTYVFIAWCLVKHRIHLDGVVLTFYPMPSTPCSSLDNSLNGTYNGNACLLACLLAYSLTHSLTPWCMIFSEKLIIAQLVKQ